MKYSIILTGLAALLSAGCAYSYAGQEGKVQTTPEVEQDTAVVSLVKDPVEKPKPASTAPCGVETFEVHFFSAASRITRTVDCVQRSIVSVDNAPASPSEFDSRQASGLPPNQWFIEVDPKGAHEGLLNNDQLLKISRQFEIDFFGKDADRGVLIYVFLTDLG